MYREEGVPLKSSSSRLPHSRVDPIHLRLDLGRSLPMSNEGRKEGEWPDQLQREGQLDPRGVESVTDVVGREAGQSVKMRRGKDHSVKV